MAIFEKTIRNKNFDKLLRKLEQEIPDSSWSANLEAGSDFKEGDARCSVRVSRIIGVIMLIVAIVFIVFALNHPEKSFPWNNTITWLLYGIYFLVTVVLLIAPKMKK